MEVLSSCQLEALKYSELQCLAKSVGLKANLKAAKLLNTLKKHFCEENENTGIKKTSPCTDIEEQNGSQISINSSTITKRHRKRTEDNAQQTKQENLNKEKMDSEKEVPISLNSEGNPDAGFEKILKINQNDESRSSGTAEKLEDFVTPSQRKERNSTRQKGVESKSLLDSLSAKKTINAGSKFKLGRKGISSTTPDFKKLHEAQFKKMLSIDEYIERKNKMRNFSNAVNEIKILTKKNKSLKTSQKENLNTNSKQVHSSTRGLLLSPPSQKNRLSATDTPLKLRRSIRKSPGTANKSILSRKSSFSSTSLSTTKNVRFSESTKDNEEKRSLIKTPSRKSWFLKNCSPDNQKSSECITSKDFKGGAMNCQTTETSTNSAVTPFKIINQTVEPTSTKKPVFDLQASLSKPLTYQPHKGKLKPWGKNLKTETKPGENHQRLHSHKKYYKEPPLQTRDERREEHLQRRKQRKDQKLSTVRRLTVA